MSKIVGKELPWEKQKEMLVEATALKLPLLLNALKETYGEEKGRQMYNEIFETNFKKRAGQFKGKGVINIMMTEVDLFPTFGWDIWVEKTEEDGKEVCYEHLGKCPHLEATRKYGLPEPCDIICGMDCEMGKKYKVGIWEQKSSLQAGDSECCFKITEYR